MKLILGCAALGGQPYAGKTVSRTEAADIISRCDFHGIHDFDTSPVYGFAEEVLGNTLNGFDETVYSKHADISTVLPSLQKLSRCTVRLMAHNIHSDILNNFRGDDFPAWADGYSLYSADSMNRLPAWQIELTKQRDCSIISYRPRADEFSFIARSIFLRGALCGGPIHPEIADSVKQAQKLAEALRLPLPALALHWALQQSKITGVIIGPASVAELDEIMAWSKLPCQDLSRLVNLIPSVDVDLRTWN